MEQLRCWLVVVDMAVMVPYLRKPILEDLENYCFARNVEVVCRIRIRRRILSANDKKKFFLLKNQLFFVFKNLNLIEWLWK